MKYKLNFSFLSLALLQEERIVYKEITDVFSADTKYTVWDGLSKYPQYGAYYYIIGFSIRKRFLQIVLSCDGDEVYFLDVKVADLAEIIEDFFGRY